MKLCVHTKDNIFNVIHPRKEIERPVKKMEQCGAGRITDHYLNKIKRQDDYSTEAFKDGSYALQNLYLKENRFIENILACC